MLCFVVSVVEALNNRIYYEGMSNKRRTCVFSFNAIPDNKIKEPLDRVLNMYEEKIPLERIDRDV